MNMPGGSEWIVILVIVVLLFGAKKLPELGGSVGRSIKEFKKGVDEGKTPDAAPADAADEPAARPAAEQ
jgi:sec-independent protein translocase protein TatA